MSFQRWIQTLFSNLQSMNFHVNVRQCSYLVFLHGLKNSLVRYIYSIIFFLHFSSLDLKIDWYNGGVLWKVFIHRKSIELNSIPTKQSYKCWKIASIVMFQMIPELIKIASMVIFQKIPELITHWKTVHQFFLVLFWNKM